MLFNSLIFVLFAVIFFLINRLLGKNVNGRLLWLTAASFFFYGWWDWRFIFLIVFSGFIDFYAVLAMQKSPQYKKLFLIISVIGNIGSLSVFKYWSFIAENIDTLFGLNGSESLLSQTPGLFLITPIGISFYTFQSMSYTIDAYRNKLKPTNNLLHFFAYLSMFPQLVAGPIVRAKTMLPQLLQTNTVSKGERWQGFQLIIRGYFKKMVIADNLAPLVVTAFSSAELNQSSMYWWGTSVAFAFQIYCDFAGYSDIARGLSKWMGYNFPDNFNHPYISTSLREFWTRWHISLSTWFKDYLYIPLGGGRVSKVRSHLNLWITMLVSGLWHGAAWTYVIWGAIHAFFSSVERITNWPEKLSKNTAARIIAWFFVTMQVLVAWIFFRANTVGQAWEIVKIMFSFVGDSNLGWGLNGTIFILIITLRELAVVTIPEKQFKSVKPIPEMLFYAVLITLIIYFRGEGSEFIYFQF
jgi:D-alanyl-lipoteichoic acid acyltransferase DltB (MBOAT superfamily)